MRFYKKQQCKYMHELIKYIKNNEHPYNFYPMIKIILMMLKRRLEYFETGDNVHQIDEKRLVIVNTLKKAIELGEYADNDSNFEFQDFTDYYHLYEENRSISFPQHTADEYTELHRKRIDAYKNFFCFIADNMYDWWD